MTSACHKFVLPRRKLLASVSTLVAVGTLTGCSWSDLLNAAAPKGQTTRVRDIAYGPEDRHRLDHYFPGPSQSKERQARGTIVFFHGGSWRTGSKDEYAFVGFRLAQEGYEVVIPNYRLVPAVRFPAFVDDAARAVAWTNQNAQTSEVSGSGMYVAGHSAGAHIAAMVSLDPIYLSAHGLEPSEALDGWVGLSGPYDFLPFSSTSVAEVFEDVAPEESQPIAKINALQPTPPALLITGTGDTTVLPKNSCNLAKAISGVGGDVELVTYDGIGHAGTLLAFGPSFASDAPVLDDLRRFIAARGEAGSTA